VFGLTESSPVTHVNPFNGNRKVGSIGIPIPETECKIVDLEDSTREMPVGEAGELLNKPDETAKILRKDLRARQE